MLTSNDVKFYLESRCGGKIENMPQDKTIFPLLDDDFSNLPPTVIITADCDPLSDDGKNYTNLVKAALTYKLGGVFIECHEDPDNAPSDGPNAVHLKDMPKILQQLKDIDNYICLLYTSPSPRDVEESRMPSSA